MWAQNHWFYALCCCLFSSHTLPLTQLTEQQVLLAAQQISYKKSEEARLIRSSFLSLVLYRVGGVTCKCDTSHSEWFCLFLHDFRGAILTLSPPQVSSLKSKLKKQSTATGSGVARAFLRSQAALFGSYRDALRYKAVSLTSASLSLSSELIAADPDALCASYCSLHLWSRSAMTITVSLFVC